MFNDSTQTRLTILKMAQEMLHNEYVDRKAQAHNDWVVMAEAVWRTQRTRLPYPGFPPYPTENDVVSKAEVLFGFLVKEPLADHVPNLSTLAHVELKEPPHDHPEPNMSSQEVASVVPLETPVLEITPEPLSVVSTDPAQKNNLFNLLLGKKDTPKPV